MSDLNRTVTVAAGDGPCRTTQQRMLLAGTSFKHEHRAAILADVVEDGLFFEVHAENYMGAGGPPHRAIAAIRDAYPLSIHGVCMSIGANEPLSGAHLARFR